MRFKGSPQFSHDQADKIGVLITNLGTPDAPTPKALRKYLDEFLSDPRVVEIPKLIWWLIMNLVILRIRPRKSAKAYKTVWTDQGSPLLFHTRHQAEALQAKFAEEGRSDIIVDFAMRYGKPVTGEVIQSMLDRGVRKLLVLPLYPQYSGTTTASTFDSIARDFKGRRWIPDLRFVTHYHDFEPFVDAAAKRIQAYWAEHGRADKLIFSYHGIPRRNLLQGDPYHCECHKTTRLIAARLGLSEDEILTTFQSRFGKQEWLKPYTDETLKSLPAQGIKSVQVFCPGFSADCLETVEEIGVENRDYFLEAGGERYEYISALNDRPEHIDALYQLALNNIQGWAAQADTALRAEKAKAMGA